eukprot:26719_1
MHWEGSRGWLVGEAWRRRGGRACTVQRSECCQHPVGICDDGKTAGGGLVGKLEVSGRRSCT